MLIESLLDFAFKGAVDVEQVALAPLTAFMDFWSSWICVRRQASERAYTDAVLLSESCALIACPFSYRHETWATPSMSNQAVTSATAEKDSETNISRAGGRACAMGWCALFENNAKHRQRNPPLPPSRSRSAACVESNLRLLQAENTQRLRYQIHLTWTCRRGMQHGVRGRWTPLFPRIPRCIA